MLLVEWNSRAFMRTNINPFVLHSEVTRYKKSFNNHHTDCNNLVSRDDKFISLLRFKSSLHSKPGEQHRENRKFNLSTAISR